MALKQKSRMDIDIDSSTCNLLPLKRYNSAPYINSTASDINTSSESMMQTIDTVARWTFVRYCLIFNFVKWSSVIPFATWCIKLHWTTDGSQASKQIWAQSLHNTIGD